jgi:hypothetical protein
MKGQKDGRNFECIFLKLQILVLSKTPVFITRDVISCEVIRQTQNYLLCKLISRKCRLCRCVLKALQCQLQLHAHYCRWHYCHIPVVTCFSAYLYSILTFPMHLLLANFNHLSSLHISSVMTGARHRNLRVSCHTIQSDSNSLWLKLFYYKELGRIFVHSKEEKWGGGGLNKTA